MKYRITYGKYNNSDFKSYFFCDTKQEAERTIATLKGIKHVTAITCIPPIKNQELFSNGDMEAQE